MLKRFFLVAIIACLISSCANQGTGPDGGPYDDTPPRIVQLSPALGACNTKTKKVNIAFDELIKLENAAEKVIVSPPQIEMPEIKVNGRRITVELLDTLKHNTTYTIDFSDAISDNNEGNPMGHFTYYFSTGNQLDTMEVSGYVLTADDLEPVKGILVGLHSDTTDTAFMTKPLERVARTDGNGRFSIKGIAHGRYRIYALKDMDGDFKRSAGENLAFSREVITPTSFPDIRYDTLWTDTVRYDTIVPVPYTHFMPDDVVLLAFGEKRTERYLLKTQRDEPEWFRVIFTAPSANVPTIEGLNFDATNAFLEQRSEGNDTITYWLRDLNHFPSVDTLQMVYSYLAFDDSLQTDVMRADTLELIPRHTMARRLKQKKEELEKWEKQREKRHKKGDFSQETPPVEHLSVSGVNMARLDANSNLPIVLKEPLAKLDTAAFHLYLMKDTIRHEAAFLIEPLNNNLLEYRVRSEWRPGQKYELVVDSAALQGLSGKVSKGIEQKISIPTMDNYGALFLLMPGADTTLVVQLLAGANKVKQQQRVGEERADFFFINEGEYYVRAFRDVNGNSKWDTGDYARGIQAEQVYYFPGKFSVRANWDIEQTWRINELPLYRQKPTDLIKQKESKDKKRQDKNAERERQRGRR